MPHLSDKERRWKALAQSDDSGCAIHGRRYRCMVEGCAFEKFVRLPAVASEYAQRLWCDWCSEIAPMYPLGARSLEAIRNKHRRKL